MGRRVGSKHRQIEHIVCTEAVDCKRVTSGKVPHDLARGSDFGEHQVVAEPRVAKRDQPKEAENDEVPVERPPPRH